MIRAGAVWRSCRGAAAWGVRFGWREFRHQIWPLMLIAITGLIGIVVVKWMVWPAYQNPIARMYTSKLGYSGVLRRSGKPFPVTAAVVQRRIIEGRFIGEGLVQAEPVQVPMIAMAGIRAVHVEEGQRIRKGQRVVELDPTRVDLKIASAEAALATARAELRRVELGTVNVLQEERPDVMDIRLRTAQRQAEIAQELLGTYRELAEGGAISSLKYADARLTLLKALSTRSETEVLARTAAAGRANSLEIARSAVREAELVLAHRRRERLDYVSHAPAGGVVERVLVHAGEYNQDPGRPAVLIASDQWFECYLDQTALGRVADGDAVEVRLGAHPGRVFEGEVTRVRPLVNFSTGGPETTRPIRPMGTGAPEWPATFAVRVRLIDGEVPVVPGMTGYASVIRRRETLAVPRGTVVATSGRRGVAMVVGEDPSTFEPREVLTGIHDDGFLEILEGLKDGDIVIADGHQVLEPGDAIAWTLPGVEANDTRPSGIAENVEGSDFPLVRPVSRAAGLSDDEAISPDVPIKRHGPSLRVLHYRPPDGS